MSPSVRRSCAVKMCQEIVSKNRPEMAVQVTFHFTSSLFIFILCSHLLKDIDTKQDSRSKVAMRYFLLLLSSTFGLVADAQKEPISRRK
jgi:hypothetical protein